MERKSVWKRDGEREEWEEKVLVKKPSFLLFVKTDICIESDKGNQRCFNNSHFNTCNTELWVIKGLFSFIGSLDAA